MDLTYSCYEGRDIHCGICESCMRRKRGFKKAGMDDLTKYVKNVDINTLIKQRFFILMII